MLAPGALMERHNRLAGPACTVATLFVHYRIPRRWLRNEQD